MKPINRLNILCCAALLSFTPQALFAAPPLDPGAAGEILRQQHAGMQKQLVPHDDSLASCDGYTNQVNLINTRYAACLTPDMPPVGSPASNFSKLSNVQLGNFCGQLPLNRCVANIINQQQSFCAARVLSLKQQAEKLKSQCSQAKNECTSAKSKKQQLDQASAALAVRRKQLEAQLTQLIREQAINHSSLTRANQEVEHQCGIQVPAHPVPQPILILPPNIR